MPYSQNAFFGLWDVYSGPVHAELLLHDDGTYGQAMWGGAVQLWGLWQLQQQEGQDVLALQVQGCNPAAFLASLQPEPVTEVHAVMNVLPNQIQLYDALLVRRYVAPQPVPMPTAAQPIAVMGGSFPAPPFQMPVKPPTPVYSAPAPLPQPAVQATPVLNQMRAMSPEAAKAVQAAQIQMWKDDQQTNLDIQKMYAEAGISRFKQNADIIRDGSEAGHDEAALFTATLNKKVYF